ncbi:hypothetical protein Sango_2975400 [Sesamum angolense]|uniref:Retrotransposon Copia-like N-terminal domain-containing protein n=1 Tax=Sesamum angolense TaxID=2727404 RepID=A0AAE1VTE9_9LAMI|nr:hypothetical protein Sango_2975400 [Sesamum angolense]
MAEFSKTATSSSPVENRTVGDSNGKSHNLDYPPLPIISAPLNGNNWLGWSRAVRIALGGRDKLSFIDGTSTQPHEGAEAIKQWKITDYMVLTWILNTILRRSLMHTFMRAQREIYGCSLKLDMANPMDHYYINYRERSTL